MVLLLHTHTRGQFFPLRTEDSPTGLTRLLHWIILYFMCSLFRWSLLGFLPPPPPPRTRISVFSIWKPIGIVYMRPLRWFFLRFCPRHARPHTISSFASVFASACSLFRFNYNKMWFLWMWCSYAAHIFSCTFSFCIRCAHSDVAWAIFWYWMSLTGSDRTICIGIFSISHTVSLVLCARDALRFVLVCSFWLGLGGFVVCRIHPHLNVFGSHEDGHTFGRKYSIRQTKTSKTTPNREECSILAV